MNTKLHRLLSLVLLTVGMSGCSRESGTTLKGTDRSEFKVGQEWAYQTRPGEEQSTFVIVKVESAPEGGVIVHISLKGLKIKNLKDPAKMGETISHMPFTEGAIKRSVTKIVNEHAALPSFERGYADWRGAFVSGQGGVFDVTVAEGVGMIEEIGNRN